MLIPLCRLSAQSSLRLHYYRVSLYFYICVLCEWCFHPLLFVFYLSFCQARAPPALSFFFHFLFQKQKQNSNKPLNYLILFFFSQSAFRCFFDLNIYWLGKNFLFISGWNIGFSFDLSSFYFSMHFFFILLLVTNNTITVHEVGQITKMGPNYYNNKTTSGRDIKWLLPISFLFLIHTLYVHFLFSLSFGLCFLLYLVLHCLLLPRV